MSNELKPEQSLKVGIKAKRFRWNTDYFSKPSLNKMRLPGDPLTVFVPSPAKPCLAWPYSFGRGTGLMRTSRLPFST